MEIALVHAVHKRKDDDYIATVREWFAEIKEELGPLPEFPLLADAQPAEGTTQQQPVSDILQHNVTKEDVEAQGMLPEEFVVHSARESVCYQVVSIDYDKQDVTLQEALAVDDDTIVLVLGKFMKEFKRVEPPSDKVWKVRLALNKNHTYIPC